MKGRTKMPYKDPDKRREWERTHKKKYRQEHPEVGFRGAMTMWKRNPTRHNARQVVFYALKSGVLTKPDHCENCGKEGCAIQAHHITYDDPLKVSWLCIPCHRQADRERQATDNERYDNIRRLTDEQVRDIRSSDDTNRNLAAIYGLSSCSISKIRNYLTYKDVR